MASKEADQTEGILSAMRAAVLDGDRDAATALARQSLEAGLEPLHAIERGFVPGLRRAGELFEEGEFFLPELCTAAEAMKAALNVLQPSLRGIVGMGLGTVVVGTVKGDIHDIGKTLVGTLLEASGFRVIDLGVDVPVERFLAVAREAGADLVCASALLTTTMRVQGDLCQALRASSLSARLLVGGAPVTQAWADSIGAAGYAGSALGAVELARRLVSGP